MWKKRVSVVGVVLLLILSLFQIGFGSLGGDHFTEDRSDIGWTRFYELTTESEDELAMYELTVNIQGKGAVEVNNEMIEEGWSKAFENGTEVTLNAHPDDGYELTAWELEGIHQDDLEFGEDKNMVTFNMTEEDKSITVHFQEEEDPREYWWVLAIIMLVILIMAVVGIIKKKEDSTHER